MANQNDETIQDVIDTMNEKQLNVLRYLTGLALMEGEKGKDVKHTAQTIYDLYFKR